jgi:hypothetical protein
MWARLQRLLDRTESRWALYQLLLGTGGALSGGGLYAYGIYATEWLAAYGPIAWVMGCSVGALLGVLLVFLIVAIRGRLIRSAAVRQMSIVPKSVNPLEKRFEKASIRLLDFVNPLSPIVDHKEFIDCEIYGPGVLIFWNRTTFQNCHFLECDKIKLTQPATMYSGLAFQDCFFLRCKLYRILIVAPPGAWEILERELGPRLWINQDPPTVPLSPSGTAPGTSPRSPEG